MKQTKNILRKAGVLLLAVLLTVALAVPAYAEEPGSSSVVTDPGSEPQPAGGSLIVTGYTVTDVAGNEIQRVEPGQKCRIVLAVTDQRFAAGPLPAGLAVNIKVASTGSFATPSLGDISSTTLPATISENGLEYGIILNDITFLGGDNNLALDISYNNYTLPVTQISQAMSQCVGTAEGGKPSTLVITGANYGGGEITAGSEFTLTATVMASGGTTGADNVAVNLTLPEQITVASGSTNVFLGSMKPGASQQVSFQLTASAVANAGSYNITIGATANSAASGEPLSAQMPLTVPIVQPERFEISRTDLPEYLSFGEEGYATVYFVNKGKGTIYNVSAEIVGEGITTTEGNQYVGNVNPGSEGTADFTIQTSAPGSISAQVIVTYEDEKANVKTLTKDFTITVEEMPVYDDPMMGGGMEPMYPMEEEPTGVPVWVWIIVGVGVVAVAVVVIVVIKKKKAKKRAAELMEDEDEDI